MPTEYPVPSDVQQITRRALPIGAVLLIACLIGGYFSPDQFFHSYLLGYIFVLNITIGCHGRGDGAAPVGWQLGHPDAAPARGRHAD